MDTPDANALHQSLDAVLATKEGMIAERDGRIAQLQADLEREQLRLDAFHPTRVEEQYRWIQRTEAFMTQRLAFLLGRHYGEHGRLLGPLFAGSEASARSEISMLSHTGALLARQTKPGDSRRLSLAALMDVWELPDSQTRGLPVMRAHGRAQGLLLRLVYRNAKRHVPRYF